MPRSEADEAAEARAKLAALKAKREAKVAGVKGGPEPRTDGSPRAPRSTERTATDPHAVIHAVFGAGTQDDDGDDAPEGHEADAWVVAADLVGEKFKMGYTNGVIRCSFIVPAEHFFTCNRLEAISDGYELRFIVQVPPEIM